MINPIYWRMDINHYTGPQKKTIKANVRFKMISTIIRSGSEEIIP